MDPLTHCLVGGMAAKTVGTSKRRFWVMCFLGSAPDLDVLFNGLGSWAWFLQHRGITHSILGILIQSLIYSAIFSRWDKGSFRERTLHYSLPLLAHVLCDFLTAFGVPLLSPFQFREYSADLMVGLTLIPIFIMVTGLVWAYMRGEAGWKGTRPIWIGWALYLCMALSGKAYAGKLVDVPGAITLPSAGNPFSWAVVCPDEGSQSYKHFELDLMRGRRLSKAAIPMPASDFPVQASMLNTDVRHFLASNRWPVARVLPAKTGWDVEWGNLLFSTRGMVRGKIRVHVEANGHVSSAQRIFSFWNPTVPELSAAAAS